MYQARALNQPDPALHPVYPGARPVSFMSRRWSSKAFTLVELLVVIGIIALLVSILLPSLGRAREQAKKVQCLSNIRQVGFAFIMYTNNNKGALPWFAPYNAQRPDDWLYWLPGRDISESAIAPYMAQPFSDAALICPSDDVNVRARNVQGGYHYSYVMNSWLRYPGLSSTFRMAQIRDSARKVMLYEEDENTIDDGYGTPDPGSGINLLAIRHDRKRVLPDNPTTGLTVNGDRRGNAAFCDGHAEYVSRNDLHTPYMYDPLN